MSGPQRPHSLSLSKIQLENPPGWRLTIQQRITANLELSPAPTTGNGRHGKWELISIQLSHQIKCFQSSHLQASSKISSQRHCHFSHRTLERCQVLAGFETNILGDPVVLRLLACFLSVKNRPKNPIRLRIWKVWFSCSGKTSNTSLALIIWYPNTFPQSIYGFQLLRRIWTSSYTAY